MTAEGTGQRCWGVTAPRGLQQASSTFKFREAAGCTLWRVLLTPGDGSGTTGPEHISSLQDTAECGQRPFRTLLLTGYEYLNRGKIARGQVAASRSELDILKGAIADSGL